jgi:hypothetical protein
MRQFAAFVTVVCVIAGCCKPEPTCPPAKVPSVISLPWGVPTVYIIEDYPLKAEEDLPALLKKYGFQLLEKNKENELVFSLANIATMADLSQVHKTLRDWSMENKKPLQLRRAQMSFSSVDGATASRVVVFGTATVGADIFVDVGTDELMNPKNNEGRWKISVPDEALPRIDARGGWVYIMFVKDTVRAYSRQHVMRRTNEMIDESALPEDSALRRK